MRKANEEIIGKHQDMPAPADEEVWWWNEVQCVKTENQPFKKKDKSRSQKYNERYTAPKKEAKSSG